MKPFTRILWEILSTVVMDTFAKIYFGSFSASNFEVGENLNVTVIITGDVLLVIYRMFCVIKISEIIYACISQEFKVTIFKFNHLYRFDKRSLNCLTEFV